ncbi:MAG: Crp/Fnr family transcriptional regulator [Bacteroidaceae bacterium]|nr:Crp/Fnr family transcriptional regulator [Bacteroidaceae bacterium]
MTKKIELSIYNKLQELPLFQGLGSSDMTWIIDKIKFDFSKYRNGETIVRQNSACDSIIFILNGNVEMETVSYDNQFIFRELLPSPTVIEPEVLFGPRTRYTHSFVAVSDVGALNIRKSEFWESLLEYEVFRLNFINMISAQAQNANKMLWQPTGGTLRERFIRFIASHSRRPSGPKRIKVKMEDLANQFCETRINVSKVLNELQDEGMIVLKRSIIEIPYLENLIRLLQQS